ncbi:MAG: ArsR family transcriptional regulator [Alphaproteobacteria bacterium]|nr:ArsR family transcriptional regulator [Alphaproteobacteria bacterium]
MAKNSNQDKKLMEAVDLLSVLSHPVRLSILCRLFHDGETQAGALFEAEARRASQSQVSQFLAQMRKLKLVASRKEGQAVYYRIASAHVRHIIEALYETYCGRA